MSFPTIPQITPIISINRSQVANLLLASVAFEELGLAHIINTEGEKIQAAFGTLPGLSVTVPNFGGLLSINREVRRTLQTVLKSQMLLQFKVEEILDILETIPATPAIPVFIDAGSAWSVGISFGQGNAQYTTLGSTETEKTVVLGLGNNYIPVGTVHLFREGNILAVTFTTDSPYVMSQVHLYVSDIPPTNSNPGGFPYQYTVTNPNDYFTTYTFNVDVSSFAGETIYVAAHAHILEQQ
ncbi:MAG TPA: hypothetical protein VFC84_13485 [Desulfosporosinus sp.]|nr:hypothetical protein [Desulfosporosinus sp.]